MQEKIKYYAGIGSRETPTVIEPMIEEAGRILTKKAFKNVKITEEFSDIVPGIYHLKFTGEGQITFTKSIEIQ